jgi:hypothetical protein
VLLSLTFWICDTPGRTHGTFRTLAVRLTRRSLPNARNPTDPTACSQFAFSLPSPVLGKWNHVLKTSVFPPPIHLMRSIFAVCFQRRSEPRQNSECGNSRSEGRIIDSSSTKAVNFSSACTTKRFPSSRCASAISHRVRSKWCKFFLAHFCSRSFLCQPLRTHRHPTTAQIYVEKSRSYSFGNLLNAI